jgi:hypothetical protein
MERMLRSDDDPDDQLARYVTVTSDRNYFRAFSAWLNDSVSGGHRLHQRRVSFDFKSDALRGFGVLFVLLIPLAAFAFFWAWLARRLPPPERSSERP